MADIRAFCAVRPAAWATSRVAALPYDVFDTSEARQEAAKDPLSFLNIDRPETQFAEGYDPYAPEVYEKAAQMLKDEIAEGVFETDPEPVYYLYELVMNGRSQTGVVACASIDDYLNGVIKKHENTRADKLQDRIRHVDVCGMQTGPIFLAYRRNAVISEITGRVKQETPIFDFTSSDGIIHRGWMIRDAENIRRIREAFLEMDSIYIADGHHRAESAVRAGLMRGEGQRKSDRGDEYRYFLSVLFPDDELLIMDYNRVVQIPGDTSCEELLSKLRQVCRMRECAPSEAPSKKGEMQVYLGHKWYLAEFLPEMCSTDPVEGLDVSVLQNRILEPFFGISDPKTDGRISFIGGIRGIKELETRADRCRGAAFRMHPTSIKELMAVADSGALMPPKSTWFEPKLRSGLFFHGI